MDDDLQFNSIFNSAGSFAEYTQQVRPVHPQIANDGAGMKCELNQFDSVFNSEGNKIRLRSGTRQNIGKKYSSKEDMSAIVKTRYWTLKGDMERTETEIRSPFMKIALKHIIPEFKDVNTDVKHIIIHGEPRCLFHFRNELFGHGMMLQPATEAQFHISFLLQHMHQELNTAIFAHAVNVEPQQIKPSMDFANLWTVFKPGELVPWYFNGYKELTALNVFPLQYHDEQEEIRQELLSRGRKYISLQGVHYRKYTGVADVLGKDRNATMLGIDDYFPIQKTWIKGRIITDPKTFFEARPGHDIYLEPDHDQYILDESTTNLSLTDEQYIICNHEIPGFAPNEKRWGYFFLDCIELIDFDDDVFASSLMLQQSYKDIILSLVRFHNDSSELELDDIIKGKGKGTIFLLHGEPGVGKTLTAADSVEEGLVSAFQLAEKWKAVALIDEADVFLEQRTVSDLARNSLVSVFLRVLEYYEGILFLTTNRIDAFDRAFRSRVQLAIYYPPLDSFSRKSLWRNFLEKASFKLQTESDMDHALEELASSELNGRQIKNVVRISQALAISKNAELSLQQLRDGLDAMKNFDNDFETQQIREARVRSHEHDNPEASLGNSASKRRRVN
ncbi:hypothetical protein G7Z17_g3076 [Cylindrodendrum hubeiense]|uniref:AAA+ ATPase domain-containing protein n=1 Tax=Cylindrodendrum hubeiense TaxID=595255 RepID=A0A9P5LDW6_9HYPO|nr:hypothetical protein G7Z17_g3076 [Cylindrodendrum hubeiense]